MNSQAAKEILDVVMMEDFVARREALDIWSRKWIATLHVEGRAHEDNEHVWDRLKAELVRGIFNMLIKNEVKGMLWGRLAGENGKPDDLTLACEMHVVLQEPRELNAGTDAAEAMKNMARGGK